MVSPALAICAADRAEILYQRKRENLMEDGGSDANAEVQTGTDRNGAETDRGGRGEWEVAAAALRTPSATGSRSARPPRSASTLATPSVLGPGPPLPRAAS